MRVVTPDTAAAGKRFMDRRILPANTHRRVALEAVHAGAREAVAAIHELAQKLEPFFLAVGFANPHITSLANTTIARFAGDTDNNHIAIFTAIAFFNDLRIHAVGIIAHHDLPIIVNGTSNDTTSVFQHVDAVLRFPVR